MPYHNPWIPERALRRLASETGSILDVGGGAAPYWRATHIMDVQPFDAGRLCENAWGGGHGGPHPAGQEPRAGHWTENQYTRWDICDGSRWPFEDNAFDLGLSSHCLEDLRDPLPAVRELSRVSRNVMIVTPSRLLEQTMNIDHPRWCGFSHHPWMVFEESGRLVFQRKTSLLNLRGCHFACPSGRTLPTELGSSVFIGQSFQPVERAYADAECEARDLRAFVKAVEPQVRFTANPRARSWRYWVFYFRRRWRGAV